MPPRKKSRTTLAQGIDQEVQQIVNQFLDNHEQYKNGTQTLNSALVLEQINQSNSSLSRRPKKILEESINRVLEKMIHNTHHSESDTEVEAQANVEAHTPQSLPQEHRQSDSLNRSIVAQWNIRNTSSITRSEENKGRELASRPRVSAASPVKRKKSTSGVLIKPFTTPEYRFADFAGIDDLVRKLMDFVALPIERPYYYHSSKIEPPKGLLIYGPPGCGKTSIVHALATELQVNYSYIAASSLMSRPAGDSEKMLCECFDEATRCAPSLIFIDQIDAVSSNKEGGIRETTSMAVTSCLKLLMGRISMHKNGGKPVIVITATSRLENLDNDLRCLFLVQFPVRLPTEPVREKILRCLTRKVVVAADVDFAFIAKRTPGYVGADLKSLVKSAEMAAIKRCVDQANAEAEAEMSKTSMDVDEDHTDAVQAGTSGHLTGNESLDSFAIPIMQYRRIKRFFEDNPHFDVERSVQVTHDDFIVALANVTSASLREGFTTIPNISFASIGALSSHIDHFKRAVIKAINEPQLFRHAGLRLSSGTLLWGPPGNGKTLLAQAVANASHANFISIKGPELLNKYVGESERAVRQLFNRARNSVPVILFFDEIDALVPRRDSTMSDASARVVSTLLTELDGAGTSTEGIHFIAATNRPDVIDPAMLRPGRLDTKLYVGLPDTEGRVDILKTLCKNLSNFVFDEGHAEVARQCDGFSGADLRALMQSAGLSAVERHLEHPEDAFRVKLSDFVFACTQVSKSVSDAEAKRFEHLRRDWATQLSG